jgi:hypothetical protein
MDRVHSVRSVGQEGQLYFVLVFSGPSLNDLAVMGHQLVKDQKDFLFRALYQLPQETDKAPGVHFPGIRHEADLAFSGGNG